MQKREKMPYLWFKQHDTNLMRVLVEEHLILFEKFRFVVRSVRGGDRVNELMMFVPEGRFGSKTGTRWAMIRRRADGDFDAVLVMTPFKHADLQYHINSRPNCGSTFNLQ